MPAVTFKHGRLLPPVLLAGLLLPGLGNGAAPPARAGLLTPLLSLARPQLESSLARQCLTYTAGSDLQLQDALAKPCEALARPIAGCLISQTEASGRAIGVISDLIAGRFGDASEVVVKRCLAITFGLPTETFTAVPLRRLAEVHGIRLMSPLARPPLQTPQPPGATPGSPGGSTSTMQPSEPDAP
jgi:hypothetical protein